MRLLIHAPTETALTRARSNARNLLAGVPDAEVEIVVNAAAVRAALDAPDAETDTLLVFCGNSLRAQGLQAPRAPVVAAAVRYIAERQAAGWAYIRA